MEAASINVLWELLADSMNATIRKYQEKCFMRKRRLDCFSIVLLILRMVASKNHQGYSSTIAEFWAIAQSQIPRLRDTKPVSSSTFCDARSKLDATIFKDLNIELISRAEAQYQQQYLWEGRRLFCIDGTKINLPRELMSKGFELPNPTSYYPIGLVSCLYQIKSKLPYDFEFENHVNERKCALNHIKKLRQGDVVVYDRGYLSYALLEEHSRLGVDAVFRLQDVKTFRVIKECVESELSDQIVEIIPTKRSEYTIKKGNPNIEIRPIKFRLIAYQHGGSKFYIGTTLTDFKRYSHSLFPDLYHSRWGIEELYKTSKQTIKVEEFHSKSEEKVRQEVYAHFLLITLSRIFANEAEVLINIEDARKPLTEKRSKIKKILRTISSQFQSLYFNNS